MKVKRFYKSISIFIILSIFLSGCKKENKDVVYTIDNLGNNDTFVIEKDGYADQPYWNYISKDISKGVTAGESGYYAVIEFTLGYINGDTLEWNTLCSNPDCVCRNPLSQEEEKRLKREGKELPKCNYYDVCSNGICYSDGYIYTFDCDEEAGKVYLTSITADGSGVIKRLCEVGAYDSKSYGGMRVFSHGDYLYVYDWIESVDGEEKTITQYSKNGEKSKVIARFKGEGIHFTNVKSYGNKLFYIVEKIERSEKKDAAPINGIKVYNYELTTDGVYVYDYETGETVRILEKNVNDFAVNEENNEIYYYVTGKGLYSKSLEIKGTDDAKLIYTANDETQFCEVSYDGKYIYLNNESCIMRNMLMRSNPKNIVLNPNGMVVNEILANKGYGTYFGDSKYLFVDYDSISISEEYGKSGLCALDKSKIENAKIEDFVDIMQK